MSETLLIGLFPFIRGAEEAWKSLENSSPKA